MNQELLLPPLACHTRDGRDTDMGLYLLFEQDIPVPQARDPGDCHCHGRDICCGGSRRHIMVATTLFRQLQPLLKPSI